MTAVGPDLRRDDGKADAAGFLTGNPRSIQRPVQPVRDIEIAGIIRAQQPVA